MIVPLRFGFPETFRRDEAGWLLLELLFDATFLFDMGLTFLTAYYKEGRTILETDASRVAAHYLSTWSALPTPRRRRALFIRHFSFGPFHSGVHEWRGSSPPRSPTDGGHVTLGASFISCA